MRGVAYSPDGRWLASSDGDLKTVCLWDAQTHQLAARFSGHTGPVYALAFSPDGYRLVSGSEDRIVRVWDVGTGQCQAELRGHSRSGHQGSVGAKWAKTSLWERKRGRGTLWFTGFLGRVNKSTISAASGALCGPWWTPGSPGRTIGAR